MAAARSILVTGGNDGIGLALCKQLVGDHGCRVFLCSRNAERGENALKAVKEYAASAKSTGGSVDLVQLDVCDAASITAAAASVKDLLKDGGLQGLVHNAGVYSADADAVLNTNLHGPKRVMDAFTPLMKASKEGRADGVGVNGAN